MEKNDFNNRIQVSKEELIPIDSLEKCLWAMEATGKIAHFGLITRRNMEEEQLYGNYYWVINHQLGELEYKLRSGEIDKKQFEEGCKEMYEKYDINFDILKDNLSALQKLEQEHTPEEESALSTQLNEQVKVYQDKLKKKRLSKQQSEKDYSEKPENPVR